MFLAIFYYFVPIIFEKIQDWNEREKNLVTKEYINIAMEHLRNYGNKLNFM